MSHSKKYRVFPNKKGQLTSAQLAQLIAAALRQDYGGSPSSIKQIGLQTGAHLRAIKNWFYGYNLPSAHHLLNLARISPSVLQVILQQISRSEIAGVPMTEERQMLESVALENVPVNVPIKQISANLNKRQAWFLNSLQNGLKVTARHIQAQSGVDIKTAKRDIAALKKMGVIKFIGARKKGYYKLA